MKLTRTYLKQLIKEEMRRGLKEEEEWTLPKGATTTAATPGSDDQQGEQEEDPKVQDLRQKLLDVAKTVTGIQVNEVEMVNLFIELIELAKRENINVGEFKRRVGMVQQAAQKIA